jgi:hypothetical protein
LEVSYQVNERLRNSDTIAKSRESAIIAKDEPWYLESYRQSIRGYFQSQLCYYLAVMSPQHVNLEDGCLPSVFLPHYSCIGALLLARFATFYYQPIELEELTDDGLSLRIRCQPISMMHRCYHNLQLFKEEAPFPATPYRNLLQSITDLQNLQLLVSLLKQRLHLPLIRLAMVLPKCILGPPLRILAEIVGGELVRLAY